MGFIRRKKYDERPKPDATFSMSYYDYTFEMGDVFENDVEKFIKDKVSKFIKHIIVNVREQLDTYLDYYQDSLVNGEYVFTYDYNVDSDGCIRELDVLIEWYVKAYGDTYRVTVLLILKRRKHKNEDSPTEVIIDVRKVNN